MPALQRVRNTTRQILHAQYLTNTFALAFKITLLHFKLPLSPKGILRIEQRRGPGGEGAAPPHTMNKKIINDPVHGFITVSSEAVMEVIDHPWMQRLRRIKQLGLTEMVYPGALHTRFHHALGAMHLMNLAMGTLCDRGYAISSEECEAAILASLLHDVGHGPFSHALEHSILQQTNHEEVGLLMMRRLARTLPAVDLALRMFEDTYPRRFFHQLVSSQLDIDRLDYLRRDSFFTGVTEGSIGAGRLIKMLDLDDTQQQVVVQEKGIYSVENFLNSRRVMYWQVYLHKTTICAEEMLIRLIRRARALIARGEAVPTPDYLQPFFKRSVTLQDFETDPDILDCYASLDDADIWTCIKAWQRHPDTILSYLSRCLVERRLFRVALSTRPPEPGWQERNRKRVAEHFKIDTADAEYLLIEGHVSNAAYIPTQPIYIKKRNGYIQEITEASDLPHIAALGQVVTKYYSCWPKEVGV